MNKLLLLAIAIAVFAASVFAIAPASDRLAKGKVFLQKKAIVAKKVEHAKAQVLATRKRVHQRKVNDPPADDDHAAAAPGDDDHAAPGGGDHAAAAGDDDPVTTAVHSAAYSADEDSSGVNNELLSLIIARVAATHSPAVSLTDHDSVRSVVSSVTSHCYKNDGSDRVFLNLEGATSSFFGSCSLSGQPSSVHMNPTCIYTATDPFGSPSNNCLPSDGGCGSGGKSLVPLDGKAQIQGSSLCTCAASTIHMCRCVYELDKDMAAAFCTGDKAPKDFTVISG